MQSSSSLQEEVEVEPTRIGWFSSELLEPELEDHYQVARRDRRMLRLRRLGVPAAVFFLIGITIDFAILGSLGPPMAWIVALRVAVAITIFGVIVIADRKSFSARRLETATVVLIVLVSWATCVIVILIRGDVMLHTLTVLVLILIFYLLFPVRLIFSLAVSSVFGALFILIAIHHLQASSTELVVVVFYVALVSVLGFLAARERHLSSRREFLGLLAERRNAEALHEEMLSRSLAEKALVESESRFRSLVELSPDAILVHRQGELLYVNPLGIRLVGADSPEDLVGRSLFEFLAPENRDVIEARIRELEEGASNLPPAEITTRRIDGREVACEVTSGPILYGGEPAVQSVVRVIENRKHLLEELTRLATTDSLTGICNRRRFFDELEEEWSRARRHRRPLSILTFDLDHFKRINDEHGHAVGDVVLQAMSAAAGEVLRSEDLLARLGGEEFSVLLPEISLEGAVRLAERLRERLEKVEVDSPEGPIRSTVSVGVAQSRPAIESPDLALKRADDALYEAKRAGRNCVRSASPGDS